MIDYMMYRIMALSDRAAVHLFLLISKLASTLFKSSISLLLIGLFLVSYLGLFDKREVFADSEPIVVYDIRHFPAKHNSERIEYYDRVVALQTLQGIVNRDKPRLFLNFLKGYDNFTANYTGSPTSEMDFDMEWLEKICGTRTSNVCESDYPAVNGRPLVYMREGNADGGGNLTISSLLKNYYRDLVKGIVVWDQNVPATSNAAISVAGAKDYIAVRSASNNGLLQRIQSSNPTLQIKENLFALNFRNLSSIPEFPELESTGSSKNNVYHWLVQKYLNTGLLNPEYVGYYVDSYSADKSRSLYTKGVTHIDWMVKNKALVFDLSPWADEKPNDDPNQPLGSDRATFEYIADAVNSKYGGITKGHGFFPWAIKYTDYAGGGSHSGVEGEWEFINIFSEQNIVNVSTDAESEGNGYEIGPMPNASFYAHMASDKPRRFLNSVTAPDPVETLPDKTYLLFGMADYDSAAWLYKALVSPDYWKSEDRGTVPLLWGFNPGIFESNPVAVDLMLQSASGKDYFGGWMGYGYYNANLFPEKDKLSELTRAEYIKYNYDVTGFHIYTHTVRTPAEGLSQPALDLLTSYSPTGIGTNNNGVDSIERMHNNVPLISNMVDIHVSESLQTQVERISGYQPQGGQPDFIAVRSVLITPERVTEIVSALQNQYPERRYEAVDPYTFFYFLRSDLQGENNYRASYISDTIPSTLEAGREYSIEIVVQNDGWDTWVTGLPTENYALGKSIVKASQSHTRQTYNSAGWIPLGSTLLPGERQTLSFRLQAPALPGKYSIEYQMLHDGHTWFDEAGDLPFRKEVSVIEVSAIDPDGIIERYGLDSPEFDLNSDGIVNGIDFVFAIEG